MASLSKTLKITNKLGVHARLAAKLVACATSFDADIIIAKGDLELDIKSLMNILMLAIPCGEEVTIKATGDDADEAIEELTELIVNKFGELE